MPRLFTGLEVPPDVADGLAMMRGGILGARWIEPQDYHVTLRFLGDTLSVGSLDVFGGDKPRALVARIAPSSQLAELQAEQERLVRRVGLLPEKRKFIPHITLARLRDTSAWHVADFLSHRGHFLRRSFKADRFVLFSSRASVGGGPYVVEAAYPLAS